MKESSEQGRSMIEMLGVLAIIGVLSVGGIAGFSKAMEKYRVNKTIQQVTMMTNNIRTLFAGQKNYKDLGTGSINCNLVKNAHIAPEEMYGTTYCLTNPFGGGTFIGYTRKYESETMADATSFGIQYEGVPQSACISLMTADWELEGMISISIHDKHGYTDLGCTGNKYTACVGGSVTPIPMPVEKAVLACDRTNNNIIGWKFY